MNKYITHLSRVSSNSKVGPIPVSTTEAKTCPKTCPFINAGCYAKTGPVSWHWNKVSNGLRGDSFNEFLNKIKALPKGQFWRHNQAGDLPGDGERLDADSCEDITQASKNKRGFTYTHYDATKHGNGAIIKAMNEAGFTVNLSGDNIDHALELSALNIGPVVAVADSNTQGAFKKDGKQFVQCPATTDNNNVSCATCQLCEVKTRKSIVYFPAHGTQKKTVNNILNKREVK